jgi:DNA-binding beta-propeller fold protein YncE
MGVAMTAHDRSARNLGAGVLVGAADAMPHRGGGADIRSLALRVGVLVLCQSLCHCGGSAGNASSADGVPITPGGTTTPVTSDAGAPVDETGLPPEKKVESSYRAPVATGKYVWIANPSSGRVAYVDASTLAVAVVDAGNAPTYTAAVPRADEDVALVLNVLSDDATMLRAKDGAITATRFVTHHGANAWAVSSDGLHAIAWSDARMVAGADPTQGFQDLTVLDLRDVAGAHPPRVLSVGYRPFSVGFSGDGTRAWAVTQDGISILDLTGPSGARVTANVATSDSPLDSPAGRDVLITPDGSLAVVRIDGRPTVTIVDLTTAKRTVLTLGGAVTDVALADHGKKIVAVVREKSAVSIIPFPEALADGATWTTTTVGSEIIGSVAMGLSSPTALLYSSVSSAQHLTLMGLADPSSYRVARLYAPVLGVFPTESADFAVVLHQALPAPATKRGAFSILPVAMELPAKIVGTDGPLTGVALTPSGDRAVISERDDDHLVYGLHVAQMPSLQTDRFTLASPPIAVGIVATARKAYVAQEHPAGRITFVGLDDGSARTLTGFELGARVVDGSAP